MPIETIFLRWLVLQMLATTTTKEFDLLVFAFNTETGYTLPEEIYHNLRQGLIDVVQG